MISQIAHRLKYTSESKWDMFLRMVYDGGHKKISNPNPETHDKYPEVTVNHALKYTRFREYIKKIYHQWMKSAEPTKADTKPYGKLIGTHTPESIMTECGEFIQSIKSDRSRSQKYLDGQKNLVKDRIEKHEKNIQKYKLNHYESNSEQVARYTNYKTQFEDILSEMDKLDPLFMVGLGVYDQSNLFLTSETKKGLIASWQTASTEKYAMYLQDMLRTIGVPGSYTSSDKSISYWGGKPSDFQDTVGEMYAYQQAVFKHLGVTHITLYRGIEFDSNVTKGSVKVESRYAASWTANPLIAARFGNQMIKSIVPVHNIILSPIVAKSMDGESTLNESEYVVMGSSDIECNLFSVKTNLE